MSVVMVNGYQPTHLVAFAALVRSGYFNFSNYNYTMEDENFTVVDHVPPPDFVSSIPAIKALFFSIYIIIFTTGIIGNVLVCYVVFRNKSMHSVTNIFIANLALSDILLCTFAVPFTPLYIFMREWVFGNVLCHLVPYAQGVSVYISAFTLMAIAIDRFFVIIHPFKPRLQLKYSFLIIFMIWLIAGFLTAPYGLFIKLLPGDDGKPYCDEKWPHEEFRKVFGISTSILQFVVPFLIITHCYFRVCCKLKDRARYKPGANTQRKIEMEWERTRRLNRMLISMVLIFGFCWLPLNVHNLVIDFYIPANNWEYSTGFFFLSHIIAMSSTCYNPFLYAWLNENFRKEFKIVIPFLDESRMCQSRDAERGNDPGVNAPQPGCSHQDEKTNFEPPIQMERPTSVKYVTETDSVLMHVNHREIDTVFESKEVTTPTNNKEIITAV